MSDNIFYLYFLFSVGFLLFDFDLIGVFILSLIKVFDFFDSDLIGVFDFDLIRVFDLSGSDLAKVFDFNLVKVIFLIAFKKIVNFIFF